MKNRIYNFFLPVINFFRSLVGKSKLGRIATREEEIKKRLDARILVFVDPKKTPGYVSTRGYISGIDVYKTENIDHGDSNVLTGFIAGELIADSINDSYQDTPAPTVDDQPKFEGFGGGDFGGGGSSDSWSNDSDTSASDSGSYDSGSSDSSSSDSSTY